jgi:hypothetical protein
MMARARACMPTVLAEPRPPACLPPAWSEQGVWGDESGAGRPDRGAPAGDDSEAGPVGAAERCGPASGPVAANSMARQDARDSESGWDYESSWKLPDGVRVGEEGRGGGRVGAAVWAWPGAMDEGEDSDRWGGDSDGGEWGPGGGCDASDWWGPEGGGGPGVGDWLGSDSDEPEVVF